VNAAAWAAFAAAAALAVTDWVGVATRRHSLRFFTKPGTMVALIVAACLLDPSAAAVDARPWFVAALVLSLAGDVLLLLPEQWFVGGLVAFLAAHLAYIVGLVQWLGWPDGPWLVVGLAVVLGGVIAIGRPLVASVRRSQPTMAAPVGAYLIVISAMVVAAFGTPAPLVIVAALLFYTSDALLGWNRFVRPRDWAGFAVMVTYHLAQGAFVLSLVAWGAP
jgi:uncharacterized membrane protein YhhN